MRGTCNAIRVCGVACVRWYLGRQAVLACVAGAADCVEALVPQYPSLEQRLLRYVSNGPQSE